MCNIVKEVQEWISDATREMGYDSEAYQILMSLSEFVGNIEKEGGQ